MTQCYGCRGYHDKLGVLVAQLGTPDAPTKSALKRYLREFLSDRRVIEVPRILWWFILNCIILQTRPKKSAANYARVWDENGSPLLRITRSQTIKLAERLRKRDSAIEVCFGMRYGNPSMSSAVEELIKKGCTRIVLLPMYPQYAAPTTASVYDAFFPAILNRRWVPSVKVVDPFFRHPLYIDALKQGIEQYYRTAAAKPDRLMLSYHGMPKQYVKKGDPYCCMCVETTQRVKAALQIDTGDIIHSYQSRFGREPWLTPYTDETFESLGKSGVKHLAVACPGFVADCLETIDEIGTEGGEQFKEAGGESLTLIPCVNDSERFIDCLEAVVKETAGDWLVSASESSNCDICEKLVCPAGVA
jgi:protoporphyrin/coproporphyrin ferrochelatase